MHRHLAIPLVLFLHLLAAMPAPAADCQDYAGGMQWVASVDFGYGNDTDIAFEGNTAYVAMNKIKLVDVSDPRAPYQFGEISAGYANPRRVDTGDGLLVAALYQYGVEIYDIDLGGTPPLLQRHPTPTPALDVCLVGHHCYVGCVDGGVLILDLADPQNPVELGSVGGGDGRRVAHRDGHLYTAQGGALVIYDLADPASPQETYRWGSSVIDAVPGEERLYVALALDGLAVFDRSSPAWPYPVGAQNTGNFVMSANGMGDHVFPVYSSWSQIECYEVSGSPPWPLIDSIDTDFGAEVLKFHGDHAYATGSETLDVYDLSQPGGGAEVLGYHENPDSPSMFAVAAGGGFAYVTNDGDQIGEDLVEVIDVRDPAAPQLVRSISYFDGAPVDLALGAGLLYVADLLGVDVVDVTDPPQAHRIAHVKTPGTAYQVEVVGSWLFLADGSGGLRTASLADDPASPVLVGQLVFSTEAIAVTVSGGLALVLLDDSRLEIVDVADPASPLHLGELSGMQFAENVAYADGFAYVGGGPEVFVVSLADPAEPELVATVPVPGQAHDLAVADGVLYLSADTAGLQVLDVSQPAAPVLLGSLDLVHISHGLAIAKGIVHVASRLRLNLAPLHCGTISAADELLPAAALGLGTRPNPFNPSTRIRFALPEATPVDLAVFDPAGRRVRHLLAGAHLAAGEHRLDWKGRDDSGRVLPSGTYLLRIEAAGRVETGKLTLLR